MFISIHHSLDPQHHQSQHFTSHHRSSLIQEVSVCVTFRTLGLCSGLHSITGIGCPGKCWKHHPWKCPIGVWMWGHGLVVNTAVLGELLDSMILQVFYIHNNSMVLSCASLGFWQGHTKQSSSLLTSMSMLSMD